ncbi:NAD(P)H-dependent glycerol-3-phosphate dehydrogenase [Adlercreutzia murintestinalis]|uniref:NAD(P)H-dependent glycerol-3-phosphate dehydrogenase n=1 Tax=Adlercreutzia murintestinalis TaxID=2941325 RepID=UPI00203CDC5D|nr:NAD(P)H-dependent glycerol-3-phosphate dehydrogenase [Adlercreutzia murintestinalis]
MGKIAIIGSGSWGTALAQLLACKGFDVVMWTRRLELADEVNVRHTNQTYLADASLDVRIRATTALSEVLEGALAAVFVTPSRFLRATVEAAAPFVPAQLPVVICSKGVEGESGLLASQMMAEVLGYAARIAVLSGPTHAEEVVHGVPSGAVCASQDVATATFFRDLFATDTFRTYTSEDIVGVELCAAFKNVIAIAVGVSYGMGYGDNTAAMIVTRGLAEMSRMVVACGGTALTCMGLAGAGDMVVTCMSQHSRNRRFGQYYLAQGKTLADFESDTHMVVEGAQAARSLRVLQERHGVDLPLTDAVRKIVWEGSDPALEARVLVDRPLKDEIYGMESYSQAKA